MHHRQTPQRQKEITQEKIRFRAFELFNSRSPDQGSDMEDWLQAEREIKNNHHK